MTAKRFAIRRSRWLRPLLWLFGGTAGRSYVEVGPGGLQVRFGWLFDKRVAYPEIERIKPGRWPWWGGLGWRTNFVGRIGLVASYEGIVDIALKRRRLIWLALLPLSCKTLTVSLEEPEAFLAACKNRLEAPDLA